ncbi:aspartic peptidase domain-containing protein [Phaeosphaeriaceae sp. PMI808]|nr:aspartic peptidase domain-containing protein [Phaeosphaeriaceae sp. PMI808]
MSNSSTPRKPAAFSFPASQYFEGSDGKWSTFVVRVGTPEQSFRVFPSTVTSETFVPLPGGCKEGSPANCPFLRGAELYQGKPNNGFQVQESSTWSEIGIYQTPTRGELGYNASGLYGLEKLGLMVANSGGPTLQNQVVGGVVNPRLWIGWLGMDVKPNNFSEFENPQRSLIKTLREENYIPGLSYGYTAGAYYKKPSVYGSLVFGGYDQSRFVPNNVTFPFDANDSRKPSLSIQSIVTRDFNDTTVSMLPDGPAYSLIDFSEPYMWLPESACRAFEKAFNLAYDNSTGLYLVDATTRSKLLQRNPSITFGLGKTANPGERVNVVLPYSAFDQQATYPIYPNGTYFFPIKRATNDSQYTIGRTFFQEAYVRIDYDRGNFSVHQALFPTTDEKQQIVTVSSPVSNDSLQKPSYPVKATLKKGAIVGVSIGSVVLAALLIFLGLWLLRRRRMANNTREANLKEERCEIEAGNDAKLEAGGANFHEKEAHSAAEIEGRAICELHDLQCDFEELEVGISKKDLDNEVELYEMDNTEVMSTNKQDKTVTQKDWP